MKLSEYLRSHNIKQHKGKRRLGWRHNYETASFLISSGKWIGMQMCISIENVISSPIVLLDTVQNVHRVKYTMI